MGRVLGLAFVGRCEDEIDVGQLKFALQLHQRELQSPGSSLVGFRGTHNVYGAIYHLQQGIL